MLSICIPQYNFDISQLIKSLSTQIKHLNNNIEIIIIDDFSKYKFPFEQQPDIDIKYILLTENIGRARIRNLFIEMAKYEYLLFLDCDSLIIKDDFLKKYINEITNKNIYVICGGRVYPDMLSNKLKKLRWVYGNKIESKTALQRKVFPYQSFMTNNFLIHKSVLKANPFFELLTRYGHEDTLLGIELMQKKIEILHIENPVLNGDIETNSQFLLKTNDSIKNLVLILENYSNPELLIENVKLIRVYRTIQQKGFGSLLKSSTILIPFLKFILISLFQNVKLFNFYKLLLFEESISQNGKTLIIFKK